MKNPMKYDYSAMKVMAIGGLILILCLALISQDRTPMSWGKAAGLGVAYLALQIIGLTVIARNGSILNIKVINPADPEKLVPGSTYWLNGETPIIYLGKHSHTGKPIFHIGGLDDPNHLDIGRQINPGDVRIYISVTPELPEK